MTIRAETITSSENVFLNYIRQESVFSDKNTMTSRFIPDKIRFREEEIKQISMVLAPLLKGYEASNLFVYGTCGTGKTVCTRHVVEKLEGVSKTAIVKTDTPIRGMYINCKMKKVADTEYRIISQILREMGDVVPDTGLPTDVLYKRMFSKIDKKSQRVIIILDEVDALVKRAGDEFLYNFTRINSELENSRINIIGITNDLSFRDGLDTRVKSTLSEEEIIFKPYNAMQLQNILQERAVLAFRQGCLQEGVISKCAALAAQEHGDARRALDLLRVSGEIADRMAEATIREGHVDIAEQKIDTDRITESVRMQPKHSQIVLASVLQLYKKRDGTKWTDSRLLTGDVYEQYRKICETNKLGPLTQRRVSDLISELDMLGIITAKVVSNGRYGRTREISAQMNETMFSKINDYLESSFDF